MRRATRTIIACSLIALFLALPLAPTVRAAEPSPGDLDAGFGGFGGDGKLDPVSIVGISIYAMALQPDEKIVLAGQKDETFALARYNPDGTLDRTFGVNGLVETTIHSMQASAAAHAVAIQDNGSIVAAGNVVIFGNRNMAIARYKPDGALDASFSADGKAQSDFDGGNDYADAVAVQSDGKIVVGGGAYMRKSLQFDDEDFALARFTADGALDTSFGDNGKVTVALTDSDDDWARALALQPDGKIVAAGVSINGDDDFAVIRLNTNGSLDGSFDGDGKATMGLGAYDDAYALVLQPDGRIILAGSSFPKFALARLMPDGSLDGSFDGDGKLTLAVGSGSWASSVILQPNGKIVAAGWGNHQFALARFNANGTLDTSFDGDGMVFTDFSAVYYPALALVLQPDGRLIAAGLNFMARYFPDGSLDSAGRQMAAFGAPATNEDAQAVVVQPDGRIISVGYVTQNTDQFALTRHNPDGSLDPTFDGDGRLAFGFGGDERARAVALRDDGQIVVAGSVTSSSKGDNFMIARFAPDGTLACFNITDFGGGDDQAYAVAIAPDQKVVAAGPVWDVSSGANEMGIVRYNANCTIDSSFGSSGKVQVGFGAGAETARAVVVQPDGRIVVTGTAGNDAVLLRLTEAGQLDLAFGSGGRATLRLGSVTTAAALARQPDGKLLIAGATNANGTYDFLLARYNADGSIDSGFGTGGHAITNFGSFEVANALALRADGAIAVVGCQVDNSVSSFALFQYNSRGLADPRFRGPVLTSFGGSNCANGVAFSGADRLVAVGRVSAGGTWNFALAQYQTTYVQKIYVPIVVS